MDDLVISTYSRRAAEYDSDDNQHSCWGRASRALWTQLAPRASHRVIVDVGCGTGAALASLHARADASTRLIGVEPAEGLRERARTLTRDLPRVDVRDGRFERLPLADASVDYLYSLMAFHWVTDAPAAAREIARVLRPDGDLDLFFIGRLNGREFVRATSPIFLRHMGAAGLLDAAKLRVQLTRDAAARLFQDAFPDRRVDVQETFETFYDSWERHQAWWVRIEAQMLGVLAERRDACMREVETALRGLATPDGIPYTLHLLHVRLRPDATPAARERTP